MDKTEVAPEIKHQEQFNKVFIVSILLLNSTYYLVDLDFSISKNIRDAILLKSEDNAHKLASEVENNYKTSLGKVLKINLKQIV